MAVGRRKTTKVHQRDGGLCVLRLPGCTAEAEVADHRANRGQGGAKSGVLDQYSNLISACSLCNGKKETVDGEIRELLIARGVRVEGHSTHAKTAIRALDTPVYYPDGKRYWLDDFGNRHEIPDG